VLPIVAMSPLPRSSPLRCLICQTPVRNASTGCEMKNPRQAQRNRFPKTVSGRDRRQVRDGSRSFECTCSAPIASPLQSYLEIFQMDSSPVLEVPQLRDYWMTRLRRARGSPSIVSALKIQTFETEARLSTNQIEKLAAPFREKNG
jgi:hypothetical protein